MELVSLGPNCHTASIIQIAGYKTCSYPFDWMHTNIKTINNCIQNDCIDFIDRSNYIISKNHPGGVILKSDSFTYLDPMFIHKNQIENEKDYRYTLRCVERFNNLQNINKPILFVHTTDNDVKLLSEDIHELLTTLNVKYTNTKYHLLIIEIGNINDNNDNNYFPNTYSFKLDNNVIVLTIYIKYDVNILYDKDKAIEYFFGNFNPIAEIIKEISEK